MTTAASIIASSTATTATTKMITALSITATSTATTAATTSPIITTESKH